MRRLALTVLVCAGLTALALPPEAAGPDQPFTPKVHPASEDGQKAIARFHLPEGIKASLWAAEPLLANPVAFSFDEKGRCFVAETYRLHHGVTDNRDHMDWLDEDLACRTVADRVAMYKRHLNDKFSEWEREHDIVRLIEDSKGTGQADKSTVFADGFHTAAEGLGAGVLARYESVYYTCIPDLWLLRDTKGTGKADERKSLASGFGVHVAFLGHDLHGLTMGPDGRLYFSVGDRGLNVVLHDGQRLFNPDSGAVLRCEPDGSKLEIVHIGLRNPQELAFDDYGNLFTVDNNSDSGDQARLVYVVEGGDSGWRTGYQYGSTLGDRGPWNAEKLWHLQHEGQPAYIVPPLAHIADGPSGLCFNPGVTGLPEKYNGHFFLCDFRGAGGQSGVRAFQVKPKGAAFELVNRQEFIWGVLATDCDFGPDGGFYVSDWVNGWECTGTGRIYKFGDPERLKSAAVLEVKKLLAEGFAQRPIPELVKLLGHADRRVRLEAQFALAAQGKEAVGPLADVAKTGTNRWSRLHAIWGLRQVLRQVPRLEGEKLVDVALLRRLLADSDEQVRVQTLVLLGDPSRPPADPGLIYPHLKAPEAAVRRAALLALRWPGRRTDGFEKLDDRPVLELIRAEADSDPYLRQAAVSALLQTVLSLDLPFGGRPAVAGDASAAVRRTMILALRQLVEGRGVSLAVPVDLIPGLFAEFLNDPEPTVAAEAARAVHDLPVPAAVPRLAALATRPGLSDAIALRALNANFRLGKPENATAVAAYAARPDAPEWLRVEAVRMLADWAKPPRRDRVTGLTQNLPERAPEIAITALRANLRGIIAGPDKIREAVVPVATRFGLQEIIPTLRELLNDKQRPSAVRVAAFRGIVSFKEGRLKEVVDQALADSDGRLRTAAREFEAEVNPAGSVALFRQALASGTTDERQAAFATLAKVHEPTAAALLAEWLDKLLAGQAPPAVRLDLLEAAAKADDRAVKERLAKFEAARPKNDHLAAWRETLEGGDAAAGRQIFLKKDAVACLRCHKVGGTGGEVGPALDGIGGKQSREYLLESIVEPNKQIAKGFETVVITTLDGRTVTGVLKSEDAKEVRLATPEAKMVTVKKEDIDERRSGPSAMPADVMKHLSKRELRDLVEFLATLK
jgi:quinoprotein glucose dehydrogenase